MQMTYAGKLEARAERRGEKKGLKEGEQKGLKEGLRLALRTLLTQKFGELPLSVAQRLETLSAEQELQRLLQLVLTVHSLAEMGLEE